MNFLLNQVVIVLFLLANLWIGLRATRGVTTMDDYALANKNLSGGIMIATLIATLFEVSSVSFPNLCHRGLVSLLQPFLFTTISLLLGLFVLPHLLFFKKERTLASVMHTLYGDFGRAYTLLIMSLLSLGVITTQLVALGGLSDMLGLGKTGYGPYLVIVGIGFLVSFYTCLGGVPSVAETDVSQFWMITIGIVLFFITSVYREGVLGIVRQAALHSPQHVNIFADKDLWGHFFRWSLLYGFPAFIISPPIVQRVLMMRKRSQVRGMFTSFSLIYPLLCLLVTVVALKIFYQDDFAEYFGDKKYTTSMADYITMLCSVPLGQSCMLVAIVAIMMSTMDSFLNALAIMWVNDVVSPLRAHDEKYNPIRWVRVVSLVLGIFAIGGGILLQKWDVTFTHIVNFTKIVVSSMAVPFLMGVSGFKPSRRAFQAGVVAFWGVLISFFFLHLYGNETMKGLLASVGDTIFSGGGKKAGAYVYTVRNIWPFAMGAHLLFFFGVHYVEYGAFVWINREKEEWEESSRHTFTAYFQWLLHPLRWAHGKDTNYGIRHLAVSLLTLGYFFIPFSVTAAEGYAFYVNMLRITPIFLCFPMMVREHWHARVAPYYFLFYYVFMGYS